MSRLFAALATGAALIGTLGVQTAWPGDVNTSRPSTGDLLFRHDDLRAYLDSRRSHLADLRNHLNELDMQLLDKQGMYSIALKTLKNTELAEGESREARTATEEELQRIRSESSQLYKDLMAVQRRKSALEKERIELPRQIEADTREIGELDGEIERINKQIEVLDRAYMRTLNARAMQAARP